MLREGLRRTLDVILVDVETGRRDGPVELEKTVRYRSAVTEEHRVCFFADIVFDCDARDRSRPYNPNCLNSAPVAIAKVRDPASGGRVR